MARKLDFGHIRQIFIGEDLTFRIQLVTKDSAGADVVEGDVSGNAYIMTIKKTPADAAALIDVDTAGGEITFANGDTALNELSGTNTVLAIVLSDTETELITEDGVYHYDIWRTDAGSESLVAFGTITFSTGVRTLP